MTSWCTVFASIFFATLNSLHTRQVPTIISFCYCKWHYKSNISKSTLCSCEFGSSSKIWKYFAQKHVHAKTKICCQSIFFYFSLHQSKLADNISNLYDLLEEVRHSLEVSALYSLYQGSLQGIIVWLREFHAREQVWDDALKQWNVMGQKLKECKTHMFNLCDTMYKQVFNTTYMTFLAYLEIDAERVTFSCNCMNKVNRKHCLRSTSLLSINLIFKV